MRVHARRQAGRPIDEPKALSAHVHARAQEGGQSDDPTIPVFLGSHACGIPGIPAVPAVRSMPVERVDTVIYYFKRST